MSKILFLTLRTFSATGGIEKVCRIMGKALYEDAILHDNDIEICSMYDHQADAFNNRYFPSENFHGFGINKIGFIRKMVQKGAQKRYGHSKPCQLITDRLFDKNKVAQNETHPDGPWY